MTRIKNAVNEIFTTSSIIILICCCLLFPKQTASGVSSGLSLCASVIIPSLFLFIFISDFTITSGIYKRLEKIGFLSKLIFKLPESTFSIILLSLIGGFPVGAKLIYQLYEANEISKNQAQRMLMFCVNAGPAFVISAVGCAMLGSYICGVIIFVSLTLSSLIIGFITRFFDGSPNQSGSQSTKKNISFSDAFVLSASNATQTTFSICTFVIIFSCLGSLIEMLNIPSEIINSVKAVLEVTTGCASLSKTASIPILTGLLGWNGLCVHCQIMQYINKCEMKLWLFWLGRISNAVISGVICKILLQIINPSIQTVSYSHQAVPTISALCIPATAGLIIMGAMLIFEVAKKDSLC